MGIYSKWHTLKLKAGQTTFIMFSKSLQTQTTDKVNCQVISRCSTAFDQIVLSFGTSTLETLFNHINQLITLFYTLQLALIIRVAH